LALVKTYAIRCYKIWSSVSIKIEYVFVYSLQVIFGIPFGSEIDMWSVGCILAELYAGKPLFYGTDENSILEKVKRSYLVIIFCYLKSLI